MEHRGTVVYVGKMMLKLVCVLVCLYFFICSLDLLATAFRLVGGRNTGQVFAQSDLMQNPIVGVMLGLLATVLVQSSSTTTSIIVGMVASEILSVRQAIPMVMGANIGTSVTNTIVSLTQIGNREEFERAFACAVHHDFFNWLCVIVLLSVEVLTGMLYHASEAIVAGINFEKGSEPPDILQTITRPFTNSIIQIDKKVIEGWSLNKTEYDNVTTIVKSNCRREVPLEVESRPSVAVAHAFDSSNASTVEKYQCGYMMANWGIADVWLGLILLAIALTILVSCLLVLVKVLNSIMKDKVAQVIKRVLNAHLPYVPWLTGYLAIAIGAGITVTIQSSSVFTSALTPLVGSGLFELERAYPLTLGSNLGTTTTGILAALAADGAHIRDSLQIALCHMLFNILGIAIFYPLPFMRWPVFLGHMAGSVVYKYRWFAIVYLIVGFFLLPLYIFGLSLLGPVAIYVGFVPMALLAVAVAVVTALQRNRPELLPRAIRTWDFLPVWIRSLEPYDRVLSRLLCLKRCQVGQDEDGQDGRGRGVGDVEAQQAGKKAAAS